jgi:hypothetical protein
MPPKLAIISLALSWGWFEIGRTYLRMEKTARAFAWGYLGIVEAAIYFLFASFHRQWFSAILLGASAGLEIWLIRRWPGS